MIELECGREKYTIIIKRVSFDIASEPRFSPKEIWIYNTNHQGIKANEKELFSIIEDFFKRKHDEL